MDIVNVKKRLQDSPVAMVKDYVSAWREFATFSGRTSRKVYWNFWIIQILVLVLLLTLDDQTRPSPVNENELAPPGTFMPLIYIYLLSCIVPTLAISSRRMHDISRPTWFLFVPSLRWSLIFKRGDKGENRYGPDPYGMERQRQL